MKLFLALICILTLVVTTPVLATHDVTNYPSVTEVSYSPGGTETLRPNAGGDVTQLSYAVPGATYPPNPDMNYQQVNDVEPDGDSTYVFRGEFGDKYDLYNLPNPFRESGAVINKITVYIRCRDWLEDNIAYEVIKSGNTTAYGTGHSDMVWPYIDYSFEWALNPDDSAAWEWADIDALQIGVRIAPAAGGYAPCTQVWVEIDYSTTPAVSTDAASSVARTTARLNATVTDDGDEACSVRWGYGNVSQTAENFESYVNVTDWDETGYTTGQHPYYDAANLTGYTLYYFRVQIGNVAANVTGEQLTFTTEADWDEPSNLRAHPSATSVSLSWTKGTGATQTLIRFGYDTYPTTNTSGALAYLGTSSSYAHSGLSIGTTIYYSAWGESGGGYSANYTTVLVTTSAAAVAGEDLPVPDTLPGWMQSPNPEAFKNLGLFYTAGNDFADAYEIPRGTFWMGTYLVFCIAMAGLLFMISRSLLAGSLILIVFLTVGVTMELLPFWMTFATILFAVGVGIGIMKGAIR